MNCIDIIILLVQHVLLLLLFVSIVMDIYFIHKKNSYTDIVFLLMADIKHVLTITIVHSNAFYIDKNDRFCLAHIIYYCIPRFHYTTI